MNQKSKATLNRYLTRIDKGEPAEEEIEPRCAFPLTNCRSFIFIFHLYN